MTNKWLKGSDVPTAIYFWSIVKMISQRFLIINSISKRRIWRFTPRNKYCDKISEDATQELEII